MKPETHRQALNRIHEAIARGHRLGICDSEGNSVPRADGSYVAKSSNHRPTAKYVNGQWVKLL